MGNAFVWLARRWRVARSPASALPLALLLSLLAQTTTGAKDPFTLMASTTGGAPETIRASGNSLVDLADDVVRTESRFSSLQGREFTASLRYGGLENAIRYSQNAAGTSGTVTIPSTGFSRTFSADTA